MPFTRIKTPNSPRSIIRLPRINKIRLGKKCVSKSGKEYPKEVSHFIVSPEVQQRFGAEPKSLPVMIPVENEEMFLRQYYATYGSNNKLKCQGDGENAERRMEDGKIERMTCPSPEHCDYAKQYKCSARTDLLVVLPDINCGGVYQLSTGSVNSDIDIRSGLEMARHLFGRVSWVPMMLVREEKKIPDPSTGKMQTHWPVKLYPTATVAEVNQIRSDTTRILERQQNFALPEPKIEGEEDTPVEYEQEEPETGHAGPAAGKPPINVTAQTVPEATPPPVAPSSGGSADFSTEQLREFLGKPMTSELLENVFLENLEAINRKPTKEKIDLNHFYRDRMKELKAAEQKGK